MTLPINPVPPNLPIAPKDYEGRFQDQFSNVLRLYFNRLKNFLDVFVSGDYGSSVIFPYGAFQCNTTQTVPAAATPTRVAFDVTDYANETYFVVGDGIHFNVDGLYNIQFSCQLTNDHVQNHDVDVWFRKNGSTSAYDVPNTASVSTVPSLHGGQPGYRIIAANFFMELKAGDFVEMWWAASSTDVKLNHLPAITSPFTSPASPAVVLTATFVSALPSA